MNPLEEMAKIVNPMSETSKTVLVVEDEDILQKVLSDRLSEDGWQVEAADDGEEAIEMLAKKKYALVLLDLLLPKKSGFDVLEEMKNNPEMKDIPVIVLSNLGGDDDIKKALSLGAVDYFVKTQHPIMEIMEKIEKYK